MGEEDATKVLGIRLTASEYNAYMSLPEDVKKIILVILRNVMIELVKNAGELKKAGVTVPVTVNLTVLQQKKEEDCNHVRAKLEAYKNKNEKIKEILRDYKRKLINEHDVVANLLALYVSLEVKELEQRD